MADSDEIFLALDDPLEVAAERVAAVLGLEGVEDPDLKENHHFFRAWSTCASRV